MPEKRDFPLAVIVSVIMQKSIVALADLFEFYDFIAGKEIAKYEIKEVRELSLQIISKQYPKLLETSIPIRDDNNEQIEVWIAELEKSFGNLLEITQPIERFVPNSLKKLPQKGISSNKSAIGMKVKVSEEYL